MSSFHVTDGGNLFHEHKVTEIVECKYVGIFFYLKSLLKEIGYTIFTGGYSLNKYRFVSYQQLQQLRMEFLTSYNLHVYNMCLPMLVEAIIK